MSNHRIKEKRGFILSPGRFTLPLGPPPVVAEGGVYPVYDILPDNLLSLADLFIDIYKKFEDEGLPPPEVFYHQGWSSDQPQIKISCLIYEDDEEEIKS